MSILDDRPLKRPPTGQTPSVTTRQRRSNAVYLVSALLIVGLIVGAAVVLPRWLWPTPAPATPPSTGRDAALVAPTPETVLPPRGEMDGFIRMLLGALSSRPELAGWLTTDDLVAHITLAIDQIARGVSPAGDAKVLAPQAPFKVVRRNGRTFIDPDSYRRYDGLAATAASIDPSALARAYKTLRPRLVEAYESMDRDESTLDEATQAAIATLLQTPIIEGPIELVPGRGNTYAYADPKLESLSPVQKQLLRMGPANVRAIQDQLRAVAEELGVPPILEPGL